MSLDAEILAKQVEQNPDEQSVYNMLVDALIESGLTPDVAAAGARLHVAVGQQARTLAQATNLMRGGEPSGVYLRSVIVRYLGRSRTGNAPILVVEGDNGPTTHYHRVWNGAHHLPRVGSVTVGAGWVLTTWAEKQARDARHAAARDRSQRS